jgi:hypothetical protein
MKPLCIILPCLFLTAVRAPAQTPLGTAFTYQGQLQNSGSPENGSCDLQFKLFDAASGGNQIGATITDTSVAIVNGLFTVALDFGAGAFGGSARWLEIGVACPTGSGITVLAPRQQLNPSPNALYASSASVATDPTLTGDGTSASPLGIAAGGVNTAQLAGSAVTTAKLSAAGSSSGDVLTSSGSSVVWQTPSGLSSVSHDASLTGNGTSVSPLAVVFAGTGIAVSAAHSDHNHDTSYWKLTGNSGTASGTNFLGTTDLVALNLRVGGNRAMRLEPALDNTGMPAPNVIGGFSGNSVTSGNWSGTIAGGGGTSQANTVSAIYGTIGGGVQNTAGGAGATVAGGFGNSASVGYATVAGGVSNTASGPQSSVIGGTLNTAGGTASTVAGGQGNSASGSFSFAAGLDAHAAYDRSFVWSDGVTAGASSTAANRLNIYSTAGVELNNFEGAGTYIKFGTVSGQAIATSTGAYLSDTGTWTNSSDRHLKEDFARLDSKDILARLVEMPVEAWRYRCDATGAVHIGPAAQDFYAAFGIGENDTHVSEVDEGGVALAAIQGLHELLKERDAEIASLEARLEGLEKMMGARIFNGVISDAECGLSHAVMRKKHGIPTDLKCVLDCVDNLKQDFVLADHSAGEVYQLDDQAAVRPYANRAVRILGTVDDSSGTIHVLKIETEK